ncbi:MAG: dUTP diphosphatase [Clostridia bacterium]|nr:dUTP diphosphatase [Clostridia bacterium]
MNVQVQKLNPDAIVPTFGSEQAAGADLYALLDAPAIIKPGETLLIKTGLAMAIPNGYVGLIFARSGLASKRGLAPANKVGVIDSDYRGELMVALHNHSTENQTVEPKERIAQLAIIPYLHPSFEVTDSLDETKRGTGGFGSTGTK